MSYIVYCYTNKQNNKKYIGITSRSMEEREASHIYESKNKSNKCYNAPFKRAIRKYGIEGFDREIIETVETLDEACELEKYYIKTYKTYYKYKNSNGYNATLGGELIQTPKDRVIQINRDNLNDIHIWESVAVAEKELNASIYDSVNKYNRLAKNSYWIYENDFNKDTYKEIIYSLNNYICQVSINRELVKIWSSSSLISEILNISQGNISACCTGMRRTANNYYWCFYNDFISNNYPIKHANDKHGKPVIQFNNDGQIIKIWDSITLASQELNIEIGDISIACKKHGHAGGFLWRLQQDYNGEKIFFVHNKKTIVEKLDENKNVICEYESITTAANDVGVKYTGICRAIKNNCKSGGYYWRKKVS